MSDSQSHYVRSVLGPFEADFRKVFTDAWAGLKTDRKTCPRNFRRTEATLMHDHLVTQIKVKFGSMNGFSFFEKHETLYITVGDKVLIRLKKANGFGKTRNYPTRTALSWHSQDNIPGLPESLIRVDMVYVPDKDNIDIKSIKVVSCDRKRFLWSYELREDIKPIATILPYETNQTPATATKQLVLLKSEAQEKRKTENNGE